MATFSWCLNSLRVIGISACLVAVGASAADGKVATDKVRAALQKQIGERAKVESVNATPIPGLFEARIGRDIVYVDATGRYLLQGELQDLQTGDNLTEARMGDLNRVRWADLPLEQAVKWTKGDGSRALAVFADPNCGYCKRLEKTFQQLDNVTVYTFLYPILAPDSTVKAQQIWCAADRPKAWLDWMLRGTPPSGATSCPTPIEKNLALGRSIGVNGTPAIFFQDGSRIPGAADLAQLERKLSTTK